MYKNVKNKNKNKNTNIPKLVIHFLQTTCVMVINWVDYCFYYVGWENFFFLSALFGRLSDGVEFVEVNKMEVKN